MAGRSTLLTSSGTQTLISWISREDQDERFEAAVGQGYAEHATPESLARDGVPLQWVGHAGRQLGLQGEATPQAAARVLTHGIGPHQEALRTNIQAAPRKSRTTGELIPQERRNTMGWVLSAPKTVSLLLASSDAAVRQAAVDALRQASDVALATYEQQVTVRRKAQGVVSEGVQGVVGVQALHFTSSAGDPHLHVHYLLNNSAPAQSDGQWRALDGNIQFAAQRVAEAAFQATLKEGLSHQLALGPEAWEAQWVGSVPTWEIQGLQPAVERFSQAMAHMQNIATTLETTLHSASRSEHDLIWAQHRQDKHAIAEALEHALDTAIAQGGEAGAAIREFWHDRLGPQAEVLAAITVAPEPQQPASSHEGRIERLQGILDGSWAQARDTNLAKLDQQARQAQRALDNLRTQHLTVLPDTGRVSTADQHIAEQNLQAARQRKFLSVIPHADRTAMQHWQDRLDLYQVYNQQWDATDRARTLAAAAHQRADQQAQQDAEQLRQLRAMPVSLGNALGPFILNDVVAGFRGLGATLPEAQHLTALALQYWTEQGLIHLPESVDAEAVRQALQAGMATDTKLQTQTFGHQGKVVSEELLQREITLLDQACNLSQDQRQRLMVDITGLSPDQAHAAGILAQGRGLTAIQGVAGAGKSYLLHPVVHAAQQQGLQVTVLARNAKLAQDLGDALHVPSETLAKFTRRQATITRPTLIVIDEAGLVDQANWMQVLQKAHDNPFLQIIGLGDRFQAQPIDRLASWAVITEGAQVHGAFAELTQTFRNQTWMLEAQAIRDLDDHAVEAAVTHHRVYGVHDGAQGVATLIEKLTHRGEDALAIAATNEDMAAIASAIQTRRHVTIDDRTALRWQQQTGLGDTIRTRKNEVQQRIHNGDTWTVTAITDRGLTLTANQGPGRSVTVSHVWARDHAELAYAATVDSAQGVTVDRAVLFLGAGMGNTRLYSGATRGRKPPVYVAAVESKRPIFATAQAEDQLRRALHRDDVTPTMREILHERPARTPAKVPIGMQKIIEDARERQASRPNQVSPQPRRQVPPQPLPPTPKVTRPMPAKERDDDRGWSR